MSKVIANYVKTELKPELDTFSAWERMSKDFSQLLRASFKVTVVAAFSIKCRSFTTAAGTTKERAVLMVYGCVRITRGV